MDPLPPDNRVPPPWEQEQPAGIGVDALPVMEYLQLLWFRKWLIIAITVFVGVVGWIHVNQIRSVYTASSKLMIGTPQSNVVNIDQVLTRDLWGDDIQNELVVFQSNRLARRVVDRLGLVSREEFNPTLRAPEESFFDFLRYLNPKTWIPQGWKDSLKEALGKEAVLDPVEPPTEEEKEEALKDRAAAILIGKLNVSVIEYSNVFDIRFTSWDPKMAARVANDIPEAYIVDQLESKFEATEKANAWLTEQIAELEQQVAESERAVEIYRDEYGIGEGAGGGLLDAELSELSSQLIVARAGAAEIEARLDQVNRLMQSDRSGLETISEVMASQMVQQLRSQEVEVMGRMSELSVELGPKHPRMIQVRAELEEIRERIVIEIQRVAAGLENEVEFARTRVNSLEASLAEAQGLSSEQSKEAVQLRALEREAAANRALFETFLNRFKETSSTQGLQTSDARVIATAQPPGAPSYPNREQKLMTFILMGFVGSCGLVIGIQFLNPGLRSPEQVQQALGRFVIGVIPSVRAKEAIYDFVLEKPQSRVVEAINSLKFSLTLSNPDIKIKAVQVTSSVPSEGKTSLALALARVEAASGKKVILIDGDLRRSSIARKLGLENGAKGLSDLVVAAEADLSEYVQRDKKGGLDFMPIGTAEYANAGDIFSSHRMEHIIGQLKDQYDLVLIDSPPVMAVADARIIGRLVDKTLFVVRWDSTPAKVARAGLEQLQRHGTDVAGVVLQQVDLQRYGRFSHGSSGYYYHYGRYGKYYSS